MSGAARRGPPRGPLTDVFLHKSKTPVAARGGPGIFLSCTAELPDIIFYPSIVCVPIRWTLPEIRRV